MVAVKTYIASLTNFSPICYLSNASSGTVAFGEKLGEAF
jgi:hypothetical protein